MRGPDTLSEALRVYRHRQQLDQATVGAALGTTQQSISHWENGQMIPRPETVPALAELLGLDEEAIVVMAYRSWKLRH